LGDIEEEAHVLSVSDGFGHKSRFVRTVGNPKKELAQTKRRVIGGRFTRHHFVPSNIVTIIKEK